MISDGKLSTGIPSPEKVYFFENMSVTLVIDLESITRLCAT